MKVKGLDGREHHWKFSGRVVSGEQSRPRSRHHLRARALLRGMFPAGRLHEEVPLPGTGRLTADFYLPMCGLVAEVQGEQHYRFNAHFHKHLTNFWAARKRDADKRAWCELNNLSLVELPHDEPDDAWRQRILDALTGGAAQETA